MTERRTLILVDFDNVMRELRAATDLLPSSAPGGGNAWMVGGEGIAVPTRTSETPTCVVAVALNTESACDVGDAIGPHLLRLAGHLAHFVAGAPTVGIELGLTLAAPQSADALLLRLLASSPRVGHDGAFHQVCLLSEDRGLVAAVADALTGWARRDDAVGFTRWDGAAAITRHAPPAPRRPRCAAASVDDARRGILVADEALALWAAGQRVDLSADLGLVGIARRCRAAIGLLSQVGPTLASIRGMERLVAALLRNELDIGACDRRDGLELRPVTAPPDTYLPGVPSRLGPGALRIEDARSTVRCRLPAAVMRIAARTVVRTGGEVDMQATLEYAKPDVFGSDPVAVDFVVGGKDLVARVATRRGEAPTAWWVRGISAKADPRAKELAFLVRSGAVKTVGARCAVAVHGEHREVILRAPLPTTPVLVPRRIGPEELGRGEAGGNVFAVLAPSRGLDAGSHECVPIQDVRRHAFDATHRRLGARLADLARFPIVIPRSAP